MGTQDKTLRATAFPFIGQVFGYNRTEGSDYNVSIAKNLGDLFTLTSAPATDNLVRILRPQYGTVVEAYFTMTASFAVTEPLPRFKVSISNTTSNTDFTPVQPTTAAIDAGMIAMTGSSNYFTTASGGTVSTGTLNIISLLPAPTDSTFRSDCFVVGVHFPTTPISGFSLSQFKVEMSCIMSGAQ